jgi:hypothetical protein
VVSRVLAVPVSKTDLVLETWCRVTI